MYEFTSSKPQDNGVVARNLDWHNGFTEGYQQGLERFALEHSEREESERLLLAEINQLRHLLWLFNVSIMQMAEVFLILYPGSELQKATLETLSKVTFEK